jgi:hypothetical protein
MGIESIGSTSMQLTLPATVSLNSILMELVQELVFGTRNGLGAMNVSSPKSVAKDAEEEQCH